MLTKHKKSISAKDWESEGQGSNPGPDTMQSLNLKLATKRNTFEEFYQNFVIVN